MVLFPEGFLQVLVYGSLCLISIGVLTLLTLLVKDARKGKLW